MDTAEKVEALKDWLSNRMGAEVDAGFDSAADTHWFRILLDVPLPPMLSVRQSVFEDHSVEEIRSDLGTVTKVSTCHGPPWLLRPRGRPTDSRVLGAVSASAAGGTAKVVLPPPGENRVAASLRPWVSPGTRRASGCGATKRGTDGIERPTPLRPTRSPARSRRRSSRRRLADPPPEESTHDQSADGQGPGSTRPSVWRKYGLKPHQIRRFKLSRDPRLVEKLHDVVGAT